LGKTLALPEGARKDFYHLWRDKIEDLKGAASEKYRLRNWKKEKHHTESFWRL